MRLLTLALAIHLLGWSNAVAQTRPSEEPSRQELMRQINELRVKIERLEAKQAQQEQSIDPRVVDETVQRVFADAQSRSQPLAFPGVTMTGGYDSEVARFFLRSEDGNFLLMPGLLFQFRNVTNWQQEGKSNGSDEVQSGFEVRRMRFFFEGNAFTPDLFYKFQWETNSGSGAVILQDAFVRYTFARDWAVQIGQFYDIPFHEQSTLDQFLLATDRSLVNALIGGGQTDRTQGVMLMYDDGNHWRGQLLFDDGYNTENTNFTNQSGGTAFTGVTPTDFGVSGRLEYFAMGTRRAYDEFTALRTKQDLLVFGIGASFSQGGSSDVLFHTADVQYQNPSGVGLYGAFLGQWKQIGQDEPVLSGNYYNWGFLMQGSYLVTGKLEVFARYDLARLQGDTLGAPGEQNVQEITVGANYYFKGQSVRFTLDASYLPDGSPIAINGLGISAGSGAQFILRGQLQLLI